MRYNFVHFSTTKVLSASSIATLPAIELKSTLGPSFDLKHKRGYRWAYI